MGPTPRRVGRRADETRERSSSNRASSSSSPPSPPPMVPGPPPLAAVGGVARGAAAARRSSFPRARATGGRSNRERRGWTRGTGSPRGEKVGAVHRHREVESVGGRGGWGRGGARLVPDGLAIVAAASGWMFLALASARGGISPRREPAPSPHGRRARRRSRIVPALLVRRRRRSRDDERGFGAGGVRGFDASMARVRRRARPRRRGWRRERHDLRSAPGGRVTGKVIAELFTRSGECRNGDTSPTFFG